MNLHVSTGRQAVCICVFSHVGLSKCSSTDVAQLFLQDVCANIISQFQTVPTQSMLSYYLADQTQAKKPTRFI